MKTEVFSNQFSYGLKLRSPLQWSTHMEGHIRIKSFPPFKNDTAFSYLLVNALLLQFRSPVMITHSDVLWHFQTINNFMCSRGWSLSLDLKYVEMPHAFTEYKCQFFFRNLKYQEFPEFFMKTQNLLILPGKKLSHLNQLTEPVNWTKVIYVECY